MKNYKISEIIYWCIATISIIEVFFTWESSRDRAYIFIGFGFLSILMALFRRHYRKKFHNHKNFKR